MKIDLEPGKYVVAVSGGVDSMVLLDLASKLSSLELVVAHFDHGIRTDSAEDRELVQAAAVNYGLMFESAEGRLGQGASEEAARNARYEFLGEIRQKHQAAAILTAHHQDDVIETAVLNMLRGTGRKGLTSLKSTDIIKRPLLGFSKRKIIEYAEANGIKWREDSTNIDTSYLRNHVRHNIISKLSSGQRKELLKMLDSMMHQNKELDTEIANYLQSLADNELDRKDFARLPHAVAREIMAGWLRQNDIRDFDKKAIERLVVAAKTLRHGQRVDVNNKNYLVLKRDSLALLSDNS